MGPESKEDDRLFVRDGWRHYRRRYSLAEVRWGLATFAALLMITGWVAWKGMRPDATLFDDGTALLTPVKNAPAAASPAPATAPPAVSARPAEGTAESGPLPKDLAGAGWREDKVAAFDDENLYVKINGRADYFKNYGFKRLWSVLLVNEKETATTIDIEMYDLQRTANALGAYGGERPAGAKVEVTPSGMHHFDRNALYLARGRYYIRVIGSDETPLVADKLRALSTALEAGVGGEPLPWAYGLFLGGLGIGADKITYFAENAFALAFARDVWTARPGGKDSDLELFVAAPASASAAKTLGDKLQKAFGEMGEPAGKVSGVALVKDQFLGLYTGVASVDRWVVGVRGAASKEAAAAEIGRLRQAVAKVTPPLPETSARPSAKSQEGYGDER